MSIKEIAVLLIILAVGYYAGSKGVLSSILPASMG